MSRKGTFKYHEKAISYKQPVAAPGEGWVAEPTTSNIFLVFFIKLPDLNHSSIERLK
jgi:hypothetical protein